MFRRPHYVALAVVVFLSILLLSLPDRATSQLKLALGGLFLPLFGLAHSAESLKTSAANALTPRSRLAAQINQLTEENQRLRQDLADRERTEEENNRLYQALRRQPRVRGALKFARVILREPTTWWRSVQIDLGSRDGVKPGLPVLTEDGLVGKIGDLSESRAQVILIGDPLCQVSAVAGRTNSYGIITANTGFFDNPAFVKMTFMNASSQLKPGDTVTSSGYGLVFPQGLLIGTVAETNAVEFGLYGEARIKLAANLNNLETVWVLFP